jgi:hypothetical protein
MKTFRLELFAFALVLLVACGGTGPGGDTKTTTSPEEVGLPVEEPEPEPEASCIDSEQRQALLALSDAALYQKALSHEMGNCYISDNNPDACWAYVQISTAEWASKGWPLNPETLNSTGCVTDIPFLCGTFDGYTPDMCTTDIIHNGSAQLRDALRSPHDICGLCHPDRPVTVEMALGMAPVVPTIALPD